MVPAGALAALEDEVFGKRILITNRQRWLGNPALAAAGGRCNGFRSQPFLSPEDVISATSPESPWLGCV